jgi:hypothetical protein
MSDLMWVLVIAIPSLIAIFAWDGNVDNEEE